MAFSLPYIGSESYENSGDVRITMLTTRPDINEPMTTALPAGQLLGYYNATLDTVELYTIDSTGLNYIKVI
jgi:hypothetical protein